jgi:hypothetical protein
MSVGRPATLRPKLLAQGLKLPLAVGGSEHWRKRAEEARRLAEQIADADAKEAMLEVAKSYERIAARAEAMAAASNEELGP